MSVLTSRHAGRYNAGRRGYKMTDQPKREDTPKVRLDPTLEATARSEMRRAGAGVVDAIKLLAAHGYQVVAPAKVAPGDPPVRTVAELAGLDAAPPLTLPELKKMNVGQMIQL